MALVLGPTNIGFDQNCQKNFNIQSPTRPGAVHIKTDAQVACDIQLGRSLTPLKGKEITFPMDLVPRPNPNSSGINRNHQNNWTSGICLGATPPFWPLGHVSCLAH
jgi:hypothetical protein